MSSEMFNLTWSDFEQCTSNSFKDLYSQKEFVDVTLVSEDDKEIKAHKVGGLLFDSPWTMGDPSPWAMGDQSPSTGGLGGGGVNVFS